MLPALPHPITAQREVEPAVLGAMVVGVVVVVITGVVRVVVVLVAQIEL